MLNSSTMALDQILEMGKKTKDHGGLGFKGENLGTNSLTPIEAIQKAKYPYRRRKTPLPTLRC